MMTTTDNKIFTQFLKAGAKIVFEVELLKDRALVDFRMNTCRGCNKFDKEEQTCGVCGCFMDVKTTHKTTRNLKKLRIETTHCPMGKWNDKEIANHYRQLDGKELLS
jgi:hypothetical protein